MSDVFPTDDDVAREITLALRDARNPRDLPTFAEERAGRDLVGWFRSSVAAQREADAAKHQEHLDLWRTRYVEQLDKTMTAEAQLAAVAAELDNIVSNEGGEGVTHTEARVMHDIVTDIRAALSSAPVAHDEAVEGASLSDLLGNARVMFWQCPIPEHAMRSGVVTVEWKGDVAHCTFPGCLRKSRDEAVDHG